MIETSRLILRPPTPYDTPILERLWRIPQVRAYLGGVVSNKIIKQRITDLQKHWQLHQFGLFVVVELTLKIIIGLCGLCHSEDGVEVSYMFFPEFWGKGFAHEAALACIDYGFNSLNLNVIIAITQQANHKSCALLHKIGMQHVKNFKRYNASQSLFQLTKQEFLS